MHSPNGNDPQLYGEFLRDAHLTEVHVWPLADTPTGVWPEEVMLALDTGFSVEQVVGAALLLITGWGGNESDMWERWVGCALRLHLAWRVVTRDYKGGRILLNSTHPQAYCNCTVTGIVQASTQQD